MKIFIDTWGWLVLADKKDPQHKKAADLYKKYREKRGLIFTSDYILDELITLIFLRRPFQEAQIFTENIFKSYQTGYIFIEQINKERFERAWELRKKYSDKKHISFTDLTSFVIIRELFISNILTQDKHFKQINLDCKILP